MLLRYFKVCNMLFIFLRNFFIFFNCITLFDKLLNSKPYTVKNYICNISISLILSSIVILCKPLDMWLLSLFPLCILFIYFSLHISNPQLAFATCFISFGISLCLFILSSILVAGLLIFPIYRLNPYPEILFIIIIGMFQSILVQLVFKFKRFKRGMPFLFSSTFINIGAVLGLVSLAVYLLSQQNPPSNGIQQRIYVGSFLVTFYILLHWWQSQLTKAYRKRLAQLELESLRTELEQKTALLKKLETQNEEMGRLIHKDNKLIPSMEHAVSTYLASGFTDIALQQAQGEALLSDLKEFSEARRGILSTFAPISAPKYNTGIPSLDAILVYMYQKAQVQDIRFYAAATPESIAALPPALTTEKLVHMLSDLLENAIIATKTSTEKQIQVQIYLANGLFTIEVADTGCSFEPATLISFGLEKASTHLTEGGSGIGLLDIWKIKEETKASIHIHEYEAGAPFSKKLFITFDKKNKYVIHTWRDKELSPLVNRGDIVILPHEQV